MYASEKVSSSVGRPLYLKGALIDDKSWSRKVSNLGNRHRLKHQAERRKGERNLGAGKSLEASSHIPN